MAEAVSSYVLPQLQSRKQQLLSVPREFAGTPEIVRLLREVDAAIGRVRAGSYGLCETCHEHIEEDRLRADPLLRFCLDHLSEAEQRDLERDLDLAARVQRALLPPDDLAVVGWRVRTHWEPIGVVSGDFYDVFQPEPTGGPAYVLFGDVAGKGVAAAMLVSHLCAAFRALASAVSTVADLVTRMNRVFKESALSPLFATLVCGQLHGDGRVDLCVAGHCPPLLVGLGGTRVVAPTGLPVGTFFSSTYGSTSVRLEAGESLVLYTDGLTEAADSSGHELGTARLEELLGGMRGGDGRALMAALLAELSRHSAGAHRTDDVSVMVLSPES
ncbi:MAG: SpoIIE family protein phosphatase [Thermoanaerobaculaceae bacterium]